MPIGGFDGLGWDETVPADTESASLGDDRIRSLKTSLRNALDAEHNWPSGGGNATGYHRLGSARAFYDVQSVVSSSGTDGRLMIASDTSRLFHVGSGGTCLLGAGPLSLSIGTTTGFGFPQRSYWAEEMGQDTTSSTGSVLITIPNSGFSGNPFIFVTHRVPTISLTAVGLNVFPIDASRFVVNSVNMDGGAYAASMGFYWRSVGTRAL